MSAATTTGPGYVPGPTGALVPLVFSYARKSPYKSDGKGSSLGVENQHGRIEEYVREAIHPDAVIVRFTDEKKSAYLDKPRPAWEEMLRRVALGEPAHMVGWHTDRMCRRVEATGRLWGLIERTGTVALHTTTSGHITDPMGLYIESIVAENESRQRSRRMRLKHDALGRDGGFSGGQRRYGYSADMGAIYADERAVIEECAGRVLNGESLGSIARSLNARYIPTARGYVLTDDGAPTPERYQWHQSSVRNMLTSPHLAALRRHNGAETAARWEPVIAEPVWRALQRKLTDPARRCEKSPSRRYLLTGIATCAQCGAGVRGTAIKSLGQTVYRCRVCFGFQRDMPESDARVREYVVARLEEMDSTGALVSDDNRRESERLTAERDGLAGRRDELADELAAGSLTASGYAAAEAALERRERAITDRLAALADEAAAPIRALEGATGPNAGRVWDEWTDDPTGEGLTRQRAIVALLLDVRFHPVTVPGRKTFDPATVQIEYRPL